MSYKDNPNVRQFIRSKNLNSNIELVITAQILNDFNSFKDFINVEDVNSVVDVLDNQHIRKLRPNILTMIKPYHTGLYALNELLKGEFYDIDSYDSYYTKLEQSPILISSLLVILNPLLNKQPKPFYHLIVNKIKSINNNNSPKDVFRELAQLIFDYRDKKVVLTEPITLIEIGNDKFKPRIVDLEALLKDSPTYIDASNNPSERVYEIINHIKDIYYEQLNDEITFYINEGMVNEENFSKIDYLLEKYVAFIKGLVESNKNVCENISQHKNNYYYLSNYYITSLKSYFEYYIDYRNQLLKNVKGLGSNVNLLGENINLSKVLNVLENMYRLNDIDKVTAKGILLDKITYTDVIDKEDLILAIMENKYNLIIDLISGALRTPFEKELLLLQISTQPKYLNKLNKYLKLPIDKLVQNTPEISRNLQVKLNMDYLSDYINSTPRGIDQFYSHIENSKNIEQLTKVFHNMISSNINKYLNNVSTNIMNIPISDERDIVRSKRMQHILMNHPELSKHVSMKSEKGCLPVFYIKDLFRDKENNPLNIRCTINRVQIMKDETSTQVDVFKQVAQNVQEFLKELDMKLSPLGIPNKQELYKILLYSNDLRRKLN